MVPASCTDEVELTFVAAEKAESTSNGGYPCIGASNIENKKKALHI